MALWMALWSKSNVLPVPMKIVNARVHNLKTPSIFVPVVAKTPSIFVAGIVTGCKSQVFWLQKEY